MTETQTTQNPVRVAMVGINERLGETPESVRERVEAYLPSGWEVRIGLGGSVVVTGRDVDGWTLEAYVLPRLASGCIAACEVDDADAVSSHIARENAAAQTSLDFA